MKRALALCLVACSVALVAVVAGGLGSATAKTDASAAAKRPLGYKLADQVWANKKLARSVKATQRILALSGVSTISAGNTVAAGVAPLSRWRMTARETVYLAMGAGNPQVTLGTIARRLGQAGIEIDGESAATALPQMVSAWLYAGASQPNEPLNQPALFVWQTQSRQAAKLPFQSRLFTPEKLVLSSLEAILILANLERVIEPSAAARAADTTAMAAQGGPCASVKSAFDSLGPVASGAADLVIGEATGTAIGAYADSLKKGSGDQVGKLLSGLDIADRLWRTYAFSQNVDVNVFVADGDGPVRGDRVHKPTDGDRKRVAFIADVGLDKDAREALEKQLEAAKDHQFQEAMRACASLHGITIPKNPYGDLAKEMEEWSAYWTPMWRGQEVVWYHPRRMDLKRIDFASAGALLKVGIEDESRRIHNDKHSIQYFSEYPAKVEIAAQKPPSPVSVAKLAAAIAGAPGGDFVGPISEMLESLFRAVAKPTATGKLIVEEHMENPCVFRSAGAQTSC
ncbi:MAG TPA: hypothetical protein VD790_00825 [Thermoleophilaceae bacterium]|nr:hypothetical protein [Thermoleophilaceae bacterium]